MEEGRKKRISGKAAIGLILLAIIADLFSLIPFVGSLSAPIFWLIAGAYLWKKGCGLFSGRKLATSVVSFVAELIPFIQTLPATTLGIIAIIIMTRREDRKSGPEPADVNMNARTTLYSTDPHGNGVRKPQIERIESSSTQSSNIDGVRAPNGGLVLK